MTSHLDWVAPDACTLPTTEQPLRVAEFDALFEGHLSRVVRVDRTQVRLELTGDAHLARQVGELSEREASCCSFFEFDVQVPGPGRVYLDIRVPVGRAEVLESLAERAETIRRPASLG